MLNHIRLCTLTRVFSRESRVICRLTWRLRWGSRIRLIGLAENICIIHSVNYMLCQISAYVAITSKARTKKAKACCVFANTVKILDARNDHQTVSRVSAMKQYELLSVHKIPKTWIADHQQVPLRCSLPWCYGMTGRASEAQSNTEAAHHRRRPCAGIC